VIEREERRRFPRIDASGQLATVPASVNVRVLDISVAGVLLHSGEPVEAGMKGNLRLHLDGSAFRADVQVQRVAEAPDGTPGYRLGATFVGLTPDLRQLIERFMAR
jgi:PilZ domain-containing protein